MQRRITTLALGVACVAALVAVPSAFAAYTSPKLQVQQTGTTTVFKISQSPDDDATALVRIFVPTGTQLTTSQAPGTVLGKAAAELKLLGLAGANVPVAGDVKVAAPGDVTADQQQRCLQGATPLQTWVLTVSIASVSVPVPVYLVPTSGALTALSPAYIATCFTSPYLTADQGGLQGQPQVVSATFSVQGVFSPVPVGAFVAVLVPWKPGTGEVNTSGTVVAPAAIAPGAVTIAAKKAGLGAVVAGKVTQAAQGRGSATVAIFGGSRKAGLKKLGSVTAKASGAFAFRAKKGTFFKAVAVATSTSAPPLCTQLAPALAAFGNIPCVNPTVNAFTASSKVVRKK